MKNYKLFKRSIETMKKIYAWDIDLIEKPRVGMRFQYTGHDNELFSNGKIYKLWKDSYPDEGDEGTFYLSTNKRGVSRIYEDDEWIHGGEAGIENFVWIRSISNNSNHSWGGDKIRI